MVEFMDGLKNLLGGLLGGSLSGLLIAVALLMMVLAVLTIILELSGRTISRKGIVSNQVRWDSTAIAIAAICAGLYIAGGMLQIAPIVPGFATLTPIRALPPILSVLFGLPGVVGVSFAMPLSDAIAGKLTLGSVAGMLSHWIALCWLPYKMVQDPSLRNKGSLAQFYLWGVIIAGGLHAIIVPGWLDFTNLLPPAAAWGAVVVTIVFNHILGPAILAPIILITVYPRVKAMGLYWRDRVIPSAPRVETKGVKTEVEGA